MIRLPRTIQLDRSDNVIFAPAAVPGEWAVTGTFVFAGRESDSLNRKEQIAFRSGFLGIESFGWSTLVTVTLVRPQDRDDATQILAQQLVDRFGAPDMAAALPAASEEMALAEELCQGHAEGTLIALHRTTAEDGIREQFRTLKPRDTTAFSAAYLGGHDKAFHMVETDEEAEEHFDLAAFMEGKKTS
ncbi:DUF6505 family protein [Sulfitobacter guttiformis]|uniref:DUF6505 family protein n=1 Tax=Sulfitobacter guttiformis TaxID=74349 RepID=UPI00046878F2|nr:DUF6505 family protein [Sulfitobacter guttiformis]KIN71946.1 hypothetical protein Z949_1112 [Sulfitobacter guttiformis KCTC 32187]